MQVPLWLNLLLQIVSGGAGLVMITAAWRFWDCIKRVESILQDFPPHRHIGSEISYPKGYEPPVVESLRAGD